MADTNKDEDVIEEEETLLKKIVFGAFDVAVGIVLFFPVIAGYSYVLIKILISGLAFILTRGIFLAIIPFILKHTDIFLDILNVTIIFADLFIDLLILILDVSSHVIHDIADVINDASRLLGGHNIAPDIPAISMHFVKISTISKHAFKRFLINVETTCPAYDSADRIFYFISRDMFNEFSCPLVRYTWPVQWIYKSMETLLSWSYHGSAAPLVDQSNVNCNHAGYGTPDYVCVGLGFGFFIVEVLIPMVIIFVLLVLIGKGLSKLFSVCLFLLFKLLGVVETLVVEMIVAIEGVEDVTYDVGAGVEGGVEKLSKIFT